MKGFKVGSLSTSLGSIPRIGFRIGSNIQTILELINMVQVFPQIHDQLAFNDTVQTLKESIQSFNFHADIYGLHTKSS